MFGFNKNKKNKNLVNRDSVDDFFDKEIDTLSQDASDYGFSDLSENKGFVQSKESGFGKKALKSVVNQGISAASSKANDPVLSSTISGFSSGGMAGGLVGFGMGAVQAIGDYNKSYDAKMDAFKEKRETLLSGSGQDLKKSKSLDITKNLKYMENLRNSPSYGRFKRSTY